MIEFDQRHSALEEHLVWDGNGWNDVYESRSYGRAGQEDYADAINWGWARERSLAVDVPPWLTLEEAREAAIATWPETTRHDPYPRRPSRGTWGRPSTVTMLGYDIWIVDAAGHRELHMGVQAGLPPNFPYGAFDGFYYHVKWADDAERINLSLAFIFDLNDIEARLARYWPEMAGRDESGVPHVVRRAERICAEGERYARFAGDVADLLEVYPDRPNEYIGDDGMQAMLVDTGGARRLRATRDARRAVGTDGGSPQ